MMHLLKIQAGSQSDNAAQTPYTVADLSLGQLTQVRADATLYWSRSFFSLWLAEAFSPPLLLQKHTDFTLSIFYWIPDVVTIESD